jgi:hypothetical protein
VLFESAEFIHQCRLKLPDMLSGNSIREVLGQRAATPQLRFEHPPVSISVHGNMTAGTCEKFRAARKRGAHFACFVDFLLTECWGADRIPTRALADCLPVRAAL